MSRLFLTILLTAIACQAAQQGFAQQAVAPVATIGTQDQPAALNERAALQFRQGDLAGAEASYMRSLELLEDTQGISSPLFVAPLAGLAAIYAAQNRHEQAIVFLQQAIAVSQRAFGLFNADQAELLEALSSSHMALDNYTEAEAQLRYLVQIAARNYGAQDPRTLPALWRLGRWYESVHNFVPARLVYARIYETARKESDNNADVIDALLAIGRVYRLQFADDPDSAAHPYASLDQVAQGPSGAPLSRRKDFETTRLDRDGQKALQRALDTLERQTDPPAALTIRTLIELGDWYMAGRQPAVALQYYARAARVFADNPPEGAAHPLLAPRLVVFHPPPSSVTYRLKPRAQMIMRTASFTLTVTDQGEPRDILLTGSDMSSMQVFQLQQALQGASFSPRFEGDRPVDTPGVAFTTQWFDLRPAIPEPAPADSE